MADGPQRWAELDFPRVLEALAGHASSELTRDLIRGIDVVFHPARIEENLDQTAELLALRDNFPTLAMPGLGSLIDLRPLWDRMAAGGVMDNGEIRSMRSFFAMVEAFSEVQRKLSPNTFPRLNDLASSWQPLDELAGLTHKLFNEHGDIRDNASPKLSEIRTKLRRYEADVTIELGSILRSVKVETGEDAILAVRSNRYVVLVPRTMIGKIPGSIVDISGSGQSAYVEPSAITKTNADRQHLFIAEQQEMRAILLGYGAEVAAQIQALRADLTTLVRFDYVLARTRWARQIHGKRPGFSYSRGFRLSGVVHPLLWKDFVPEDIYFEEQQVLIISGVNAGGKTVLLKILGLYSLLAALGCYLPGDGELPYLSGVMADIGDEQSTVANLSTFTAHLQFVQQLYERLQQLGPDPLPLLVLIDEVGTGTEPSEGAAFAYGLVTSLLDKPVKLAVTTHYDLLKTLAFDKPGVKNISLQFDREKLRPTYRVLDDQPGQSFALAIAERWGIPTEVVRSAESVLGQEEKRMNAIIGALEEAHATAEESKKRIQEQEQRIAEIQATNQKLNEELKTSKAAFAKQAEKMKADVKQKMDELLVDTKKRLKEKARQSVRKQDEFVKAASKTASLTRRKQDQLETEVDSMLAELQLPTSQPAEAYVPEIGEKVRLRDSRIQGTVETVDKTSVVLAYLGKRLTVNMDQVEPLEPVVPTVAPPVTRVKYEPKPAELRLEGSFTHRTQDSFTTLDLHGYTTEEATEALEEFLSQAMLGSISTVRIMHGIGSGRLRSFVHNYLKRHRDIASVRYADTREGGIGVTIAELR